MKVGMITIINIIDTISNDNSTKQEYFHRKPCVCVWIGKTQPFFVQIKLPNHNVAYCFFVDFVGPLFASLSLPTPHPEIYLVSVSKHIERYQ